MIGRLHYATIAISILLVALLVGVSTIISNKNLAPIHSSFESYNLNQHHGPLSGLHNIKNIESDVLGTNKTNATNILYKLPKRIDTELPLLTIKPGHVSLTALYELDGQELTLVSKKTRFDFESAPEFMAYQHSYNLDKLSTGERYLLVSHENKVEPTIEIWDYKTYNRIDNQYNQLFTAIIFGILLLILVNAFFYLIIKRREYLLYIFYNTTFLIFLMGTTGYIYQFPSISFLADSRNILFVFLCISMYALYTFTQAFLSTKSLAPFEHKLFNGFRLVMVGYLITGIILYPVPQLLVNFTNFTLILAFPLYVWVVFKLLRKGNRQAFFFALAFALLTTSGFLRALAIFGVLPLNFITAYGFAVASLLEATIFTLGLADRVLQIKAQRDDAQKESLERTQAYELQKEFSTLLNNINQKLHKTKAQDYETVVVRIFLKELAKRVKFVSGAAVYQMDTRLSLYTRSDTERQKFQQLINDSSLQIKRICDLDTPQKLETDILYDNMFIIPVSMRSHEWSCIILEVHDEFEPTESMLDFLQHYATELIRCLLNVKSLRLIQSKAETDELTQLSNRGATLERLGLQFMKALRSNQQLSIAFVDVDDFKSINDSFGHEAGDRCLRNLAKLLRDELPNTCTVGRYGGDEFLIVLPEMNKVEAKRYLEIVSAKIIPMIIEGQKCQYTISIGISDLKDTTKDKLQMIREADKALYVSKDRGKNQINLAR
ncbi:diguanylate cyclase [Kangiella spongicola]|uniref:diguanylate cyclase n=1 Tax=Kangiella spongicola TaxID=796379 RepID=A0A318D4D0_9GAMM|nr:diguanylate cyclase [Kangiella spongicola]PXF62715.1 hypothetical protein DL796_10340 [Kangiella spongicola]